MKGAIVTLLVIFLCGCHFESSMILSSESRLPAFVQLPAGVNRKDVTVNIDILNYIPIKWGVVISVCGADGKRIVKKYGVAYWHPLTVRQPRAYPEYIVIKVDGIVEIFEHRERGRVLYVSDNIGLRKTITANGKYRIIGKQ